MTHRRMVVLFAFPAIASLTAIWIQPAIGQSGPLEVIPLAQGYSPERQIQIGAKGPTDVLQAKITLQPGGELGWHTHPGTVIMVTTKGSLTEYNENGCISTFSAGSVLIERPGEVHRIVNPDASVPVEAYATFLLPAGSPPLLPAAEPKPRVCGAGESK